MRQTPVRCPRSSLLWNACLLLGAPDRKPIAGLIGPKTAGLCSLILLGFRAEEFHVTDPECHCQLIDRHDRRVPAALLQAADVLLAEAGDFG
jgi:hypothetical protein